MTPEQTELLNDAHIFRELHHTKQWETLCKFIGRHREAALVRLLDMNRPDSELRYWQGVIFGLDQVTLIPEFTIRDADRLRERQKP